MTRFLEREGEGEGGRDLIHAGGERLGDESGDLVHEVVGFAGVEDSGEAAHVGAGRGLELLEPVVHDPALPGVVDGVGGRDGGVEEALGGGLGGLGAVDRHLDDGVHRDQRPG